MLFHGEVRCTASPRALWSCLPPLFKGPGVPAAAAPGSGGTGFLSAGLACGLLLPPARSCLLSCCWKSREAQPQPSLPCSGSLRGRKGSKVALPWRSPPRPPRLGVGQLPGANSGTVRSRAAAARPWAAPGTEVGEHRPWVLQGTLETEVLLPLYRWDPRPGEERPLPLPREPEPCAMAKASPAWLCLGFPGVEEGGAASGDLAVGGCGSSSVDLAGSVPPAGGGPQPPNPAPSDPAVFKDIPQVVRSPVPPASVSPALLEPWGAAGGGMKP